MTLSFSCLIDISILYGTGGCHGGDCMVENGIKQHNSLSVYGIVN